MPDQEVAIDRIVAGKQPMIFKDLSRGDFFERGSANALYLRVEDTDKRENSAVHVVSGTIYRFNPTDQVRRISKVKLTYEVEG